MVSHIFYNENSLGEGNGNILKGTISLAIVVVISTVLPYVIVFEKGILA